MKRLWLKSPGNKLNNYWFIYIIFVIVRVVLIFVPQFGYIHPDEFFQTVEIVNGDHFHLMHERTWEFNNTMPLRSMTLQFLLLRIPWCFMEVAATYIKYYLNIDIICGYTLLVFPRFVYCILSFLNDWSMYKVCHMYGLQMDIRLMVLASSWIIIVFATRTFSNTLEMCFSSLLLYYVADCMIQTNSVLYKKSVLEQKYNEAASIAERVKIWKLKNALPAHNFKRFFATSTLCVAGVFNRPTFLLFGGPMVFYWLLRGLGTKTVTFLHFHLRMILFCLSALPALITFVLCDSIYYRHLTAGEIQTFHISLENFLFTPWNFIKYNLIPSNTAQHGYHPKYLHILVNIPLLFNVLGLISLITFLQLIWRFFKGEYHSLPKAQSLVGLMLASTFVPLFGLSLFNHQEARFLIPLTFPIVLLNATKLQTGFCKQYPFYMKCSLLKWLYKHCLSTEASAKYVFKFWFMVNITLVIFFGFIHQGGVYPLTQYFEQIMKMQTNDIDMQSKVQQQQQHHQQDIHLITSHIYKVPLTLINIPAIITHNKSKHYKRHSYKNVMKCYKCLHIHDYGSSLDMLTLIEKLKSILLYNCEYKKKRIQRHFSYRLFLVIPTTLNYELVDSLQQINSSQFLQYNLIEQFYPHLSMEAAPMPAHILSDYYECLHSHSDVKNTLCFMTVFSSLATSFSANIFSINFLQKVIQQFSLSLYEFQLNTRDNNNNNNNNTETFKAIFQESSRNVLNIDKQTYLNGTI